MTSSASSSASSVSKALSRASSIISLLMSIFMFSLLNSCMIFWMALGSLAWPTAAMALAAESMLWATLLVAEDVCRLKNQNYGNNSKGRHSLSKPAFHHVVQLTLLSSLDWKRLRFLAISKTLGCSEFWSKSCEHQ